MTQHANNMRDISRIGPLHESSLRHSKAVFGSNFKFWSQHYWPDPPAFTANSALLLLMQCILKSCKLWGTQPGPVFFHLPDPTLAKPSRATPTVSDSSFGFVGKSLASGLTSHHQAPQILGFWNNWNLCNPLRTNHIQQPPGLCSDMPSTSDAICSQVNTNIGYEGSFQLKNKRHELIREGVRKKTRYFLWSFAKQGGRGSARVVKKPYCFFEEEKKYFFREHVESF